MERAQDFLKAGNVKVPLPITHLSTQLGTKALHYSALFLVEWPVLLDRQLSSTYCS